jgi:hypothetical protein
MAVGGIVANNFLVELVISYWVDLLNTSVKLHLFSNDADITPATVIGDLTECTFPGYAAADLSGDFGGPVPIAPGEYQSQSSTFTFTCTGGGGQNVWGYWLDDGGTGIYFAESFSAPVNMLSGANLPLQFNLQEWALALVP